MAASLQSAIALYERGFHEGGAEKVRRRFEQEFIRQEEKHRSEQLFFKLRKKEEITTKY